MASFVQEGGRWRAFVYRQGTRKSKTFDRKTDAKTWAARIEAEIAAGAARGYASHKETVADLIDRYVAEVRPLKPWGRSKDHALETIRRGLGHLRASDLTAQQVMAYARQRGAGPVSVAAELSYLGGLLTVARAVWRLEVPRDAVADARAGLKLIGAVGKSQRRERTATDEEIERVKPHWRSLAPVEVIDFAVDSAMRLSEIFSLRWDDLEGQTILIRDRKHPQEKLGNDQRVPLLGRCPSIIAAQPRVSDRIFPFVAKSVGVAWQRATRDAGVEDLHFHDLRHTGISRLFRQGYRIEQVALVSGHRDWAMLKRYTHIRAEDLLRD